jgi:hypothetical protein
MNTAEHDAAPARRFVGYNPATGVRQYVDEVVAGPQSHATNEAGPSQAGGEPAANSLLRRLFASVGNTAPSDTRAVDSEHSQFASMLMVVLGHEGLGLEVQLRRWGEDLYVTVATGLRGAEKARGAEAAAVSCCSVIESALQLEQQMHVLSLLWAFLKVAEVCYPAMVKREAGVAALQATANVFRTYLEGMMGDPASFNGLVAHYYEPLNGLLREQCDKLRNPLFVECFTVQGDSTFVFLLHMLHVAHSGLHWLKRYGHPPASAQFRETVTKAYSMGAPQLSVVATVIPALLSLFVNANGDCLIAKDRIVWSIIQCQKVCDLG